MAFTHGLSTNNYGPGKLIVATSAANGTHTTLASAMADALSGDTIFIRDSVTENVTLTPGVNLVGWDNDSVSITGTLTMTAAGACSIVGLTLITNSASFLSVTGSAASVVTLHRCNLSASNATGITFSSSSGSAVINIFNCLGDIGTTGIALFAHSSSGFMTFGFSSFTNSGASTTASTISAAGNMTASYCVFSSPITSSSTAAMNFFYSRIATNAQNVTCATFGGSSASGAVKCAFQSGTASALSIGGANVTISGCDITSTNANAITGAGTIKYNIINWIDTGKSMNVTTQTPLNFGTWTPTIVGTVAGTTTYTVQAGMYTLVGNIVYVEATITITAATGTGTAIVGGLPFTIKNIANYLPIGTCQVSSATWAWPASNTTTFFRGIPNSTTANIGTSGSANVGNIQMTNGAATFVISMWYQI
jgi:hypothetical protein